MAGLFYHYPLSEPIYRLDDVSEVEDDAYEIIQNPEFIDTVKSYYNDLVQAILNDRHNVLLVEVFQLFTKCFSGNYMLSYIRWLLTHTPHSDIFNVDTMKLFIEYIYLH